MYKEDTDSSLENTKVNLSSNLIIYIKVFALTYKYKIYLLKLLLVAKLEAAAQQYKKTYYFANTI